MDKKEQVVTGFMDLYNKMVWLNRPRMEEVFKDFKPSELLCIEYIGKNLDSNVTKLADSLYMTRSAISKIAKKLLKKGLIESYQKPENKKEIYFRLTQEGKAIDEAHRELHQEFSQRDEAVFEQITEQQLDNMLKFIAKYNEHLDIEMKEHGIHLAEHNKF